MNGIVKLVLSSSIAVALATAAPLTANAATAPPSPIIDNAQMLSASQESQLTETIGTDNKRYGLAFAVETIPALNGRNLQELTLSEANRLGVGSSASNNGIFILIARDDHKIRIDTGSGVASKISGDTIDSIVADDMTPAFRQEDYLGGITAAVHDIGETYAPTPDSPGKLQEQAQTANTANTVLPIVAIVLGIIFGIVVLAVVAWALISVLRHRNQERIRREKNIRHSLLQQLAQDILRSPAKRAEFDALKEDGRIEYLRPLFAKVESQRSYTEDGAYVYFMREYMLPALQEVYRRAGTYKQDLGKAYYNELRAFSIAEVLEQTRPRAEALAKQQRVEKDRADKAAAERKAREAAEKAEAKKYWDSLSAAQKEEIRHARTKSQKVDTIAGFGTYNHDQVSNIFFPYFLLYYAAEVGQPQSSSHSSSSSNSSSSSSSSNYSSPSYTPDTTSYGGGSFGGDGGGGGW